MHKYLILALVLLSSCQSKKMINSLSYFNLKGDIVQSSESNYNAMRQSDGSFEMGNKSEVGNITYEFNEKGNLIKQTVNNGGTGSTSTSMTWTYNADDRIQELVSYAGGQLDRRSTYEYENKDRALSKDFGKGAEPIGETISIFKGFILEKMIVMDLKKDTLQIINYEIDGSRISKQSVEDKMLDATYITELNYNDKNDISATKFIGPGVTNERTYEYMEFDEKGNWIKRLEKDANGKRAFQVRTITYRK